MKPITFEDLQAADYPQGPELESMLRQAVEYQQRGITDSKYLLKLLRRDFAPPPPPMFVMRGNPAPLAEAIRGESAEEKRNIAATRNQMQQLLCTPVITRGAILPDACPAGKAPAVIPVGGAIAVENAIIPSAHSADICCSMMATFYDARSNVAAELDALVTSTRFGAGHRHLDDLVHDAVLDEDVWENRFLSGLRDHARTQIADQGDGNHFAFIGEMDVMSEFLLQLRAAEYAELADLLAAGPHHLRVLVTHHGSRGLGAHVFKRGQIVAEKHVARVAESIPEAAVWLDFDSDAGRDYWEALQYVSRWTRANHRAIHSRFLDRIGAASIAEVGNEHNFVWKRGETFYHGCIMAGESDRRWRDDEELTPKQIRQIGHRADRRKTKQHLYDSSDEP